MKLHDIALQVPLELKGHTQGVAEIWLAHHDSTRPAEGFIQPNSEKIREKFQE